MAKKNKYIVNIDMKWSIDYAVMADSEAEAKKVAWEKFRKSLPKKSFEILADKESV